MQFDPYQQWLSIPSGPRPPSYHVLLGVAADETDVERLREALMTRYERVRSYHLGQHSLLVTRLLDELTAAFNCLSDPARRSAYWEREAAAAVERWLTTPAPPADVYELLDVRLFPADRTPLGEAVAAARKRLEEAVADESPLGRRQTLEELLVHAQLALRAAPLYRDYHRAILERLRDRYAEARGGEPASWDRDHLTGWLIGDARVHPDSAASVAEAMCGPPAEADRLLAALFQRPVVEAHALSSPDDTSSDGAAEATGETLTAELATGDEPPRRPAISSTPPALPWKRPMASPDARRPKPRQPAPAEAAEAADDAAKTRETRHLFHPARRLPLAVAAPVLGLSILLAICLAMIQNGAGPPSDDTAEWNEEFALLDPPTKPSIPRDKLIEEAEASTVAPGSFDPPGATTMPPTIPNDAGAPSAVPASADYGRQFISTGRLRRLVAFNGEVHLLVARGTSATDEHAEFYTAAPRFEADVRDFLSQEECGRCDTVSAFGTTRDPTKAAYRLDARVPLVEIEQLQRTYPAPTARLAVSGPRRSDVRVDYTLPPGCRLLQFRPTQGQAVTLSGYVSQSNLEAGLVEMAMDKPWLGRTISARMLPGYAIGERIQISGSVARVDHNELVIDVQRHQSKPLSEGSMALALPGGDELVVNSAAWEAARRQPADHVGASYTLMGRRSTIYQTTATPPYFRFYADASGTLASSERIYYASSTEIDQLLASLSTTDRILCGVRIMYVGSSPGTVLDWIARLATPDHRLISTAPFASMQPSTRPGATFSTTSGSLTAVPPRVLWRTAARPAAVTAVAFSPDRSCVAAGREDGTIELCIIKGGAVREPLRAHDGRINAVAWVGRGRATGLASGGADGVIRVWHVESGRLAATATRNIPLDSDILAMDYREANDRLAVGLKSGDLFFCDPTDARAGQRCELGGAAITHVRWNPLGTGDRVVTGDADGTVWLITWQRAASQIAPAWGRADSRPRAIAQLQKGKTFHGKVASLPVTEVASGGDPSATSATKPSCRGIAISPSGNMLALAMPGLELWECQSGLPRLVSSSRSGAAAFGSAGDGGLLWHPRGEGFVGWSQDTATFFNTLQMRETAKWKAPATIAAVDFDTSGSLMAVGLSDGLVAVWQQVNTPP